LNKVIHLTSVHTAKDVRIYYKECLSLAQNGYKTHLVVPGISDSTDNGVFFHGVTLRKNNRIKRVLLTGRDVYRKASKLNGNLYHFHDPELIPVGIILALKGKKVIYDVHEDHVSFLKQKTYVNKFTKMLLAIVIELIEKLGSKFFEIVLAEKCYQSRFPGKTLVLNYPKDFVVIKRNNRKYLSVDKLLYTGGITEDRGALIYASIVREMDDVEIQLVGRCPKELSEKIKTTAENGANRIFIDGINHFVPFNRITEYYTNQNWLAGLAIFPPTPNYLNKELTKFFEYMAAGLPIIYSNFTIWNDLIGGANAGLAVNPENINEIVSSIRWLKDNPEERRMMGKAGQKAVLEKYNWKSQEKNLIKLYRQILNN